LVLVGDHTDDSFYGCYEELVALCRQLELTERVTFTGFVPDEHLVALYNAATLVVLPSFNEGFGLPVVEAMACGVPVAASRRGSLPEVVGSAGVLFDPGDHGEMASVLVRLLDDSALRQHLRAEGLRRAENFSWKAAATKAVHLFEEMAYAAVQTA
jgi:glycosyltransferase involved in cell wall biosynthesis